MLKIWVWNCWLNSISSKHSATAPKSVHRCLSIFRTSMPNTCDRRKKKMTNTDELNFSYIDAKYLRSKESNYVGKNVEYVSPVLLRAGLKIRHDRWNVQLQGSYN